MKCAVDYPPDTEFPIENLPYGVFSTVDNVSEIVRKWGKFCGFDLSYYGGKAKGTLKMRE